MKTILLVSLIVCVGIAEARSYDNDDYHGSRGQISIGSDGIQFNIGPTYREREYRGDRYRYQRCWHRDGQLICKEFIDHPRRHYDEYNYDDGRW